MAGPTSVVELLQNLVAIPSVNPQGDPGTDKVGEQAIGEYVADFLRHLGAEVTLDAVQPGRPNVIATFAPPESDAPRLAFAPHLDTVSVAGMTIPPFDPVLRDGKVWGRGASDTKGPMAAALWALHQWAHTSPRRRMHWTFLALMGEEAGNDGARAMVDRGFSSDLVLALEPTQLQVVTAHKGVVWLEILTRGVACHGATPENGRNAIYAMRRVLEILETSIIPELARRTHPQLGASSLNVGTISGGSKINIVPDRCRIEVDCRLVPGLKPEDLRKLFEEALRGEDVEIRWQRHTAPLDTSHALPWVKRLREQARGFDVAPWFSDAGILSGPKCAAVSIGPGSIAQAHTKDEFILVRDLEEGADFFRRWIESVESS